MLFVQVVGYPQDIDPEDPLCVRFRGSIPYNHILFEVFSIFLPASIKSRYLDLINM